MNCSVARVVPSLVSKRAFSISAVANRHVAVLGAAGGIGQPLSYSLKLNPEVTKLSLYDIRGAPGVAADLSHVPTTCQVKGYGPTEGDGENSGLNSALSGVEIVLIPAGVPRKPGMTRDDLFNTNASIVRDLVKAVAKVSPTAMICIISNPVNSTVPIAAEVLKSSGVYDPARLFGVTTLDVLRSATFLSEIIGAKPESTNVTVIGGHAGATIIPLLSQHSEGNKVSGEVYSKLVHRIMYGGDEVVQAKDGAGSATLSMAIAAAKFTEKLIAGLNGEANVVTPSYVQSPLYTSEGVDFFASNVTLGKNGIEKVHPVGNLSNAEQDFLKAALPDLKKQIAKGVAFAQS